MAAWEALVAKGCTCGDEPYTPCPIHTEPGDNRGIRAWFLAGLPGGFPMVNVTCAVCGCADCLMYPSPEQDEWADEHDGEPTKHFPSTVCPRCSTPGVERRLVAAVERQGLHKLNPTRVFA
jgi:hypothetical protein